MKSEEIANRMITHVLVDLPPTNGRLRKMTYYTQNPPCNHEDPYFHGMGGIVDSVTRDAINDWIKAGQVIELPEPLNLDSNDDLWLNSDGHLCTGYGWAPWENKTLVLKDFLSYKK
jgi:hypothetical protein